MRSLSLEIAVPLITGGKPVSAQQALDIKLIDDIVDIDQFEIHSYDFPRWRGGLMFYAQGIEGKQLSEKLKSFGITPSPTFKSWIKI